MFASEFSSGLDEVYNEDSRGKREVSAGDRDVKFPKKKKNIEKKAVNQEKKIKNFKVNLFQKNAVVSTVKCDEKVKTVKEPLFSNKTFADVPGLHPYTVSNLEKTLGVTKVTAIQDKTINIVSSGKDCLIQSQTGSGKTLAYAVPLIEKLHVIRPKLCRKDGLRAVIVLPTRELAIQTYECFVNLLKPYTWLVPGLLIGGEKRKSEKARLRKGITILIGTPGRLLDHSMHTQVVSFAEVEWFIIDEADRLLDLGYEKDISRLIDILDRQCKSSRQTLLLSATLTSAVERLAGLSLKDPEHIGPLHQDQGQVNDDILVTPEALHQYFVIVPPKLRLVTLSAILLNRCAVAEGGGKFLVFMGTQMMVDYHTELLATVLTSINFYKLHGNMTQVERADIFHSFRKSSQNGVLFCSDVAARGLDLPQVDCIVQYTAPVTMRDYVHRVGRTARVGYEGNAILMLAPQEAQFVSKLEEHGVRMNEIQIEDCLKHLTHMTFDGLKVQNDAELAAAALQSRFETAVLDQKQLHELGCKGFVSWVRFYASYSKELRDIFNFKQLHLGHYAKSFALKDPPTKISGIGKPKKIPKAIGGQSKPRERKRRTHEGLRDKSSGAFKSNRSEFDGGIPVKKRRKQDM